MKTISQRIKEFTELKKKKKLEEIFNREFTTRKQNDNVVKCNVRELEKQFETNGLTIRQESEIIDEFFYLLTTYRTRAEDIMKIPNINIREITLLNLVEEKNKDIKRIKRQVKGNQKEENIVKSYVFCSNIED